MNFYLNPYTGYVEEFFLAVNTFKRIAKESTFEVIPLHGPGAQVLKAKSSRVNLFNTFENYHNERRL